MLISIVQAASASSIVRASAQGALLILLVMVLRLVIGKRIAPAWWCAIWLVAGVRLMTPGIGVGVWEGEPRVVAASAVAAPAGEVVVERGSLIKGAVPHPVIAATPTREPESRPSSSVSW